LIQLNVDLLPARIVQRGAYVLASLAVFFGASFTILPIVALFNAVAEEGWSRDATQAVFWFLIPCALFLVLLLWGLNQFVFQLTILLDTQSVRWQKRTLLGTAEVVEPFSNFQGICGQTRHDSDEGTFYELLLRHREDGKTVLIYQADSPKDLYDRWNRYCRVFRVRPVEFLAPNEPFSREIEDLGRSLISLIREGKLVLPNPGQPPPNIVVDQTPDHTAIHIAKRKSLLVNKEELRLVIDGGLSIPVDMVDSITIEQPRPFSTKPWLKLVFSKQVSTEMLEPKTFSLSLSLVEGLPLESLRWLQRFVLRSLAGVY
jgi:hypothetical protein